MGQSQTDALRSASLLGSDLMSSAPTAATEATSNGAIVPTRVPDDYFGKAKRVRRATRAAGEQKEHVNDNNAGDVTKRHRDVGDCDVTDATVNKQTSASLGDAVKATDQDGGGGVDDDTFQNVAAIFDTLIQQPVPTAASSPSERVRGGSDIHSGGGGMPTTGEPGEKAGGGGAKKSVRLEVSDSDSDDNDDALQVRSLRAASMAQWLRMWTLVDRVLMKYNVGSGGVASLGL